MKKSAIKDYFFLNIVLLLYSANGIFSKIASEKEVLSAEFICYYSLVLVNLAIYAILWQQILKKISLTTAFSNKSVIVIWGLLWGAIFFHEQITFQMIIGTLIIIFGIYLVVTEYE